MDDADDEGNSWRWSLGGRRRLQLAGGVGASTDSPGALLLLLGQAGCCRGNEGEGRRSEKTELKSIGQTEMSQKRNVQ